MTENPKQNNWLNYMEELPLDWRMRRLCYALNSLDGVATYISCAGHIEEPKTNLRGPIRYFLGLKVKEEEAYLDGEKLPLIDDDPLAVLSIDGMNNRDVLVLPVENLFTEGLRDDTLAYKGSYLLFDGFDFEKDHLRELGEKLKAAYSEFGVRLLKRADISFTDAGREVEFENPTRSQMEMIVGLQKQNNRFLRKITGIAEEFARDYGV